MFGFFTGNNATNQSQVRQPTSNYAYNADSTGGDESKPSQPSDAFGMNSSQPQQPQSNNAGNPQYQSSYAAPQGTALNSAANGNGGGFLDPSKFGGGLGQQNPQGNSPAFGSAEYAQNVFNQHGATPNSTSIGYWSDPNKVQELINRGKELQPGSDGKWYYDKFLNNAEEITGGAHQTAMNMWGHDPAQDQQSQGQMNFGGNTGVAGGMNPQMLQTLLANIQGGQHTMNQPNQTSNYFGGGNTGQQNSSNMMDISTLLPQVKSPMVGGQNKLFPQAQS